MANAQEWLSENAGRHFPFKDTTTGMVPNDFISDFHLFASRDQKVDAYLAQISFASAGDLYHLVFKSCADDSLLIEGDAPRLAAGPVIISNGVPVCYITPGPLWQDPTWRGINPIGSWVLFLTPGDARVEESLIPRGVQGIRRILLANPDTLVSGIRNNIRLEIVSQYSRSNEGFFTIEFLHNDVSAALMPIRYSSPSAPANTWKYIDLPQPYYDTSFELKDWDPVARDFTVGCNFFFKIIKSPSSRIIQGQTFKLMAIAPVASWGIERVITLKGGYNVAWVDDGDTTSLSFDIGAGLGEGPAPDDSALDYVATLNLVSPDTQGNFNIEGLECIRCIAPQSGGSIIPATVQLLNDCTACCSCKSYRCTSAAISRRSAKIRDIQNLLGPLLDQCSVTYNEGVYKIFCKYRPIISCKGAYLKAAPGKGSILKVPVQNLSDVPAYAFVSISTDIFPPLPGPPLIVSLPYAEDLEVPPPDLTGSPPFYGGDPILYIKARKNSLPGLAPTRYDPHQPDPADWFPQFVFSPEYGNTFLVGATDGSPMDPIPPGGHSILYFSCQDLFLTQSRYKIRSCCAFGSAPYFSLKSETIYVSAQAVPSLSGVSWCDYQTLLKSGLAAVTTPIVSTCQQPPPDNYVVWTPEI
jgi:hypothetical protein